MWCNRNKTPLHGDVVYMSGIKGDASAEVAIQYNDGFSEFILSFANDVHTPEGGMHETGFKAALTGPSMHMASKPGPSREMTGSRERTAGRASPPSSP